ncbi:hypothetical protein [Streptomyces sp. NPDC048248]|uniref:hypothetical protein n=1 Tax=Streptomyces sp. NPDC048248 TaxID=3365523 RepID=UPI003714AA23
MRRDRQPRRLGVGETTWLWSVRHRHPECREILSLHHPESRTTLRLVFAPRPGRLIPDGYLHTGAVANTLGDVLNLREPGVVRRFLDEAVARGVLPTSRTETEIDGWPLFDALAGR